MIENNIYNIDSIIGMKLIPIIESIDLILTDPPYNTNMNYGDYNDNKSYDEYLEWSKLWFNEAKRISKSVVFTPGYINLKMWIKDIEYPKGIVVLYLPNTCSSSNLGGWNHCEPLLVYGDCLFGKNAIKYNLIVQKDIGNHPCPKQLGLYIDILKQIRPKPNCVLDPFMGSGTTIMAAKSFNYNYIGYEINKDFFINSKSRIDNYNAQVRFI